MNRPIPRTTKETDPLESPNEHKAAEGLRGKLNTSRLVPCVLLLPANSEPILSLLQKAADHGHSLELNELTSDAAVTASSTTADSWLGHSEAAQYLGISKSTLYHYSCHDEIERRKFGGRLQYRRSALDKFKEAHILEARAHRTSKRIIPSALSSGK